MGGGAEGGESEGGEARGPRWRGRIKGVEGLLYCTGSDRNRVQLAHLGLYS
jgi:hypothetical protein